MHSAVNSNGLAVETTLSLDNLATVLNASRRTVERQRAAGRLPKPDFMVGKMPRWKAETIRKWMSGQVA